MKSRMVPTTIAVTVSALAVAFVGAGPSDSTPSAAPASSKLAPLTWLAGSWRAESGGDQLDEVWTTPSADSMFGAFRWMKGGKAWMFEMLTIMDEGDDVILRIKHFDNKGVGWEEKDQAATFKLLRHDAQTIEFERIESDKPTKITYRKPSADELVVELQRLADGQMKKDEFRFRRVPG